MKLVNVGICGLGTVGSGTFNILTRNKREIDARSQCDIQISHIGVRRDNPKCNTGETRISRDIFDVANDPKVDIVVELIGGTTVAKELVSLALSNGKHVVTANKALIAEHGNELFDLAKKHSVSLSYEAAVAGGIPIISAMREGLAANKIEWLAGIINGTGNFILTEMRDKGRDFSDVLAEAQELGYAEADPTFDVEGIDAAHKLVILASIAFGIPLQFDKVFCEGISKIEPQDIVYAEELGYRIKHLGLAVRRKGLGIELRVHPTLIPEKRLIANVDGVMNAILVKGDAVGPTMYYGAGAGDEATGSAVVSDIIRTARLVGDTPDELVVPALGMSSESLRDDDILQISETESSYYLRLYAIDKPGVLSDITQIVSESGISIKALIQKAPEEGQVQVPVILLTSKAIENQIDDAITKIEALASVQGEVVKMRVESLK